MAPISSQPADQLYDSRVRRPVHSTASWLGRLTAKLAGAHAAFRRERRPRPTVIDVAELDDRLLQDLGLHWRKVDGAVRRNRAAEPDVSGRPATSPSNHAEEDVWIVPWPF